MILISRKSDPICEWLRKLWVRTPPPQSSIFRMHWSGGGVSRWSFCFLLEIRQNVVLFSSDIFYIFRSRKQKSRNFFSISIWILKLSLKTQVFEQLCLFFATKKFFLQQNSQKTIKKHRILTIFRSKFRIFDWFRSISFVPRSAFQKIERACSFYFSDVFNCSHLWS